MKCIGLESTAHTFSCAVVDDKGRILNEVREIYRNPKKGIIPNECAEFLKKVKDRVVYEVIKDFKKFDLVSFSQGPGMPLSLWVGAHVAKELAKKYEVPLVGVNHLISHLEIGKLLCKVKDPVFILATGANTQIIGFEGGKYRIFGECLSIGLGNALDKFGREIGIGFPAGPKIEELAKKGSYIELPYVVKGMDVEFSGIVTKAIQLYNQGVRKEDLCYSIQETFFSMLTEVAERALAHTDKKELLLIGGVAANKRLISMLEVMCKERECGFEVVPMKWSGDNGAQIAWQGILDYKKNKNKKGLDLENVEIKPRWRVDD